MLNPLTKTAASESGRSQFGSLARLINELLGLEEAGSPGESEEWAESKLLAYLLKRQLSR